MIRSGCNVVRATLERTSELLLDSFRQVRVFNHTIHRLFGREFRVEADRRHIVRPKKQYSRNTDKCETHFEVSTAEATLGLKGG